MHNKFLSFLTFGAIFFLAFAGVKAQSNSEYNFRQQSVVDGQAFNNNGDPTPILSMSCLAANGYGQWTVSSSAGVGSYTTTSGTTSGITEYPKGWYLLANGIYAPSTHYDLSDLADHPQCIPPGVVQCGSFPGVFPPPTLEAEVTANMNGTVDYVWPDRTMSGTPFVVNQFTSSDVDLSLPFLDNPTPVTAPGTGNMNVVTSSIHVAVPEITTACTCSTYPPTVYHNVVTASAPQSYQDEFHVASDARYLYIVWCTTTNLCVVHTSEVWATVVDQTTLTTVTGWPQLLGTGLQPTVACDPRNNRTSPSPAFEVAWLLIAPTDLIERRTCTAGSLGSIFSLPGSYISPVTGTTTTWNSVLHARILVSSAPGATPVTAVYAIVNDEDHTDALIFYKPGNSSTVADYVDGAVMLTHASPITGTGAVLNYFITAFANPYDAGDIHNGGSGPDQFHCLYQFSPVTGSNPLIIVEGADNGELHPSSTTDTRLVLNQSNGSPSTLLTDPTSYVGAVNQMGIHVHWLTPDGGGTHFYARDMNRTFDENIEESTLVTDQCEINDGSITGTNQGGTVGATLLDNTSMTIWTDPNYGANPSDLTGAWGVYQPYRLPLGSLEPGSVGELDLADNNVALNIGTGTGTGAALTLPTNFWINYNTIWNNPLPPSWSGQSVNINAGASMDYYGLPGTMIDGTLNVAGTGVGWNMAEVTVEPGADFSEGFDGTLNAQFGEFYIFYGWNEFPLTTAIGSPNPSATGQMTLDGQTILTNSFVFSTLPYNTDPSTVILTVNEAGSGFIGPGDQFLATNCWFENIHGGAAAELLFESEDEGLKPLLPVDFESDWLDATKIHYVDPGSGSITVNECTFDNQHGRTINIENLLAPTGLSEGIYSAPITISNNTFRTIASNIDPDDAAHGTYGIYIKGMDGNFDGEYPDMLGNVVVEDNYFTDNNLSVYPASSTHYNLINCSAICFENTTGNIIGNTISDPFYTIGIFLLASPPPFSSIIPQSNTLICGNIISNLCLPNSIWTEYNPNLSYSFGIYTNFHIGRSRYNTITECQWDYVTSFGYSYLAYNLLDNYPASDPSLGGTNIIFANILIYGGPTVLTTLDLSDATSDGGNNTLRQCVPSGGASEGLITNSGGQLLLSGGKNNLYLCNWGFPNPGTGTQPNGADATILAGGNDPMPLGDIDYNFWGIDAAGNKIDPANELIYGPHSWNANLGSSQQNAYGISFSPSPTHTLGSLNMWAGNCEVSLAVADHKGAKPLTVLQDTSCQHSYNVGNLLQHDREYAASYDTLKEFVERCPTNIYAPGAFGGMTGDVGYGGDGSLPGALMDFRQWLISALAWNTSSPNYFCSDVFSIMQTFGTTDTGWAAGNKVTNEGLSVLYWLQQNPLCYSSSDSQLYVEGRGSQREEWIDWPGMDTSKTPLDTTIYTMQQLGLDSVLKYAGLLGVSNNTPSIISNATAYPNPTGEGTVISFGIAREAYVAISLYDVLGHQVSSSGFGGVVEPGNLSVPMSLVGLPAGTYFARIQTTYGETQTVKLVKE